MIVNDGGQLAELVAQRLLDGGWRIVALNMMSAQAMANVPGVSADAGGGSDWDAVFGAVATQFGRIAVFVDIFGSDHGPGDERRAVNDEVRLKSAFAMAGRLKPYLATSAVVRPCFMSVSRIDGALALGGEARTHQIVSSGLFALVKTLRSEWPSVFCRAVDVSPAMNVEAAAQCVVDELFDTDLTMTEVGWGPQGRCTVVSTVGGHA